MTKRIKETKCTCKGCGNIWFYGKKENQDNKRQKMKNCSSELDNLGSDLMCCGGCLPAMCIPRKQTTSLKDLNKCPKCNSSAVKKETVIHEV